MFIRKPKSMHESVRYFPPTEEHTFALCALGHQVFSETFARFYEPLPFAQFLEDAYGPEGSMARDLVDSSIHWQVASVRDELIGYAKVSPLVAPAPDPQPGAAELQQIYVLSPWHGKGVSDRLIGWALDTARGWGAPEMYLTVFDHNARAKAFYSRHGFSEVGRCTFRLGERIDDDRIWRKLF